ncbi:uncharacterized protein C2845_PM12G16440 [Panicum miliaceum]|uniref:Disease resistance R13L4/SHOC-2-like LRR domain-containing protein n=1 Tax=Panicum miliaceum TaxID=4540 RepID=A0A3L6QC58_PANMI|nr:uncharacterized protein C2845_PM12G16440 [Panicum miliaceum]
MAEPGGETIAPPPPPRTSEPPPLAVVEPGEETTTPPPPPQETEPTGGVASALGPAPPTAEPARRAPPQEKPNAAAVGQPQQATKEEDRQPPRPTKAEEVAALPPPSETPSQERAAAAVEAEKQLPATPAPAPTQQQPQKRLEGGAAEEASSVHDEENDAEPARVQEGRRRWRHLQAAVCLVFLCCRRAPRGDQSTPQSPLPENRGGETKSPALAGRPPMSRLEEKKPTLAHEGDTKPSSPDGKQPASGQEQVATSPPPAEASSLDLAAAAADAGKTLAAPLQQQPPQEQEVGAPEQAASIQEEKDAAPARAQEGQEEPARRRWRWLRAVVNLLFLRPKPKDKEGEATPSAPGRKQAVSSGLEDKKTTPAEKLQRKDDSPGGVPTDHQPQRKKADEGEMKPSAPDGKEPASGKKEQKPAPEPKPHGKDSTGGVLDNPEVKQKDEGEGSKGQRHHETEAAPAGPGETNPLVKRFQKAGKRFLRILSWYEGHRSSGVGGEPAGAASMEQGKGADVGTKPVTADEKQAASGQEEEKPKPPHPKWPREEERLEEILEGAFTRLLASEYHQLSNIRQKCLLPFSVFELASEVKKQCMVYWWVSEFNLQHRSDQSAKLAADVAPAEITRSKTLRRARETAAPVGGNHLPTPQGKVKDGGNPDAEAAEGIFSELSSHGFLEPMKNWCSKVIHGCKVNPMVHWMLKRRARDDRFADLDVNGNPAVLQPNSSILCLTAGNRFLLQWMRTEDESQQIENKQQPKTTRTTSLHSPTHKAPPQDLKNIDYEEIAQLFKGKRVILNLNAHVYPVSKSTFSHLADCLAVLQLGRWCNLDDNTYMEVDGLESLSTIDSLKNLRYLSLRGLSRLTELPKGIRWLKKLSILDMRGCQNLVNVASEITKTLKQLTHLDLTECYMLEHIGRGITSLSELRVFKGFVFATGTRGNRACRLQDLRRLKKLQKHTVSITTDANVGKVEMAELKHLVSLRKLTIIWSEIPSILDGDSDVMKKRREDLIEKWTSFELPQELLKLDLRCYPKNELKLKEHKNLKKLYFRGGDLEIFSIDESKLSNPSEKTNRIKTLRLRYLKFFNMKWEEIRLLLEDIEYVELCLRMKSL